MRLAHCLALVFLLGGVARADILHLNNGRTLEGRVVKKGSRLIKLEVPGGMLQIPASTVKRIERRRTPREDYAIRARRTDMNDPGAIESLALWASRRGLGEQAKQLRSQAKGIKLQRRVDAVRGTGRAQDYVDIYDWARQAGYSETVQRWLLDRALKVDDGFRPAQRALGHMARAKEARRVAREERAEAERLRTEARRQAWEDKKRRKTERVQDLEQELAQEKTVSEELREQIDALEQRQANAARRAARVRRRRRRNKSGSVVIQGPRVITNPPDVSNKVILVPEPSTPSDMPLGGRGFGPSPRVRVLGPPPRPMGEPSKR